MCVKTVKLCQEENTDHDDVPPRGNYTKFSDDKSSYTERSIDKLCHEEDTDNADALNRGNYSDFRC